MPARINKGIPENDERYEILLVYKQYYVAVVSVQEIKVKVVNTTHLVGSGRKPNKLVLVWYHEEYQRWGTIHPRYWMSEDHC